MYQECPGQNVVLASDISASDGILYGGENLAAQLGANYTTLLFNSGSFYEIVKAEKFGALLKITRGQYGSTAQPWFAGSCARWIPEPKNPCVGPSVVMPQSLNATINQFAFFIVVISGEGPFEIQDSFVPSGMNAMIYGTSLVISGIPVLAGLQPAIVSIKGCCGFFTAQTIIDVGV